MTPACAAPTRGSGKLEGVLAQWRMNAVLAAIKPSLHGTEILDIGCGSYPLWLANAPFQRKVGMDQAGSPWTTGPGRPPDLEFVQFGLGEEARLPFPDASFSCVSSLAVIEHLEPAILPGLMAEIHRILKPGGQVLLTTPHAYADSVLRGMARMGLVSKEEIDEHKSLFFHGRIRELLRGGGFPSAKTVVSGLMVGLNILAVAEK